MWTKRWVGLRPLHYPAPPKSRRSYTSSSLILHLWASAALIRLPASEAEGQDRRVQRPAANAVLTTVVDTWGRFCTPRCLSRSSGPLRWAVVDLCGPGHSPEKRTVEDQCRSAVTAGAPMAAISLSWRRRAECLPRGTWSGSRPGPAAKVRRTRAASRCELPNPRGRHYRTGRSRLRRHWFRRLRIRWEIRDVIHEAFLSLACAIICWRRLRNLSLC